jgi:putative hemolysin
MEALIFITPILLFFSEAFIELTHTAILAASQAKMASLDNCSKALQIKKKAGVFVMIIVLLESILQYIISFHIANIFISYRLSGPVKSIASVAIGFLSVFTTMVVKSLALKNPENIAVFCGSIFHILFIFLSPVGNLMYKISNKILGKNEEQLDSFKTIRKEIGVLIQEDRELLNQMEELKMIQRMLALRESQTDKIMTHRSDFITIQYSASYEEILKQIYEKEIEGVKNLIVVDEEDNILGTMNITKFLVEKPIDPNTIVEKPSFVVNTTNLYKVLQVFVKEKKDILFVIDEYGDIEGIVTESDFFTEIVGKEETEEYLRKTPAGIFISGSFNIRSLNREMNWNLPDDEVTIGGFISSIAQGIPSRDDVINYKDFKFNVLASQRNKIDLIFIPFDSLAIEPAK